jgi:hypothetical protein
LGQPPRGGRLTWSQRGLSLQRRTGYREYAPGYYAAYLLDPDDNNVEALHRDVGNIGHGTSPNLR